MSRGYDLSAAAVTLTCPRCDLTLEARLKLLAPRHCPRCLARRRIAVPLESSAAVSATSSVASAAEPVPTTSSRAA